MNALLSNRGLHLSERDHAQKTRSISSAVSVVYRRLDHGKFRQSVQAGNDRPW